MSFDIEKYDGYSEEEIARIKARAKRREQMRLEKEMQQKRIQMIHKIALPVAVLFVLVLILILVFVIKARVSKLQKQQSDQPTVSVETIEGLDAGNTSGELTVEDGLWGDGTAPDPSDTDGGIGSAGTGGSGIGLNNTSDGDRILVGDTYWKSGYDVTVADNAAAPGEEEEMFSSYAILIDESTGTVLVNKGGFDRINPASMTKILTVLVAAEHISNVTDKVTITFDMVNYAYVHDLSAVNWDEGEEVTVEDLFYGTILQSGADAALGLATYVAGSQEAFVELMNQKLDDLGLSSTSHFTNCIGLYDENHYSTPYDMAVMLKAAEENDYCREVLGAHRYTTSSTEQHPDGINLSNLFLRRIEDHQQGVNVLGAKTGYVKESRNCAASYAISDSGTPYICVTADTYNAWRAVKDHVSIYERYTK